MIGSGAVEAEEKGVVDSASRLSNGETLEDFCDGSKGLYKIFGGFLSVVEMLFLEESSWRVGDVDD